MVKHVFSKIYRTGRMREPKKRGPWSVQRSEFYITILIFLVAPEAPQPPTGPVTRRVRKRSISAPCDPRF